MSQTQMPAGLSETYEDRTGGRSGWLTFAGVMFITVALVNALWGISALVEDDYFRVDELLFGELALWGAVYLVFAGVCLLTGVLILRRADFGIVLGVTLAVLHGLIALTTVGAAPVWTVTVLVIDGLIIYGLLVHSAD